MKSEGRERTWSSAHKQKHTVMDSSPAKTYFKAIPTTWARKIQLQSKSLTRKRWFQKKKKKKTSENAARMQADVWVPVTIETPSLCWQAVRGDTWSRESRCLCNMWGTNDSLANKWSFCIYSNYLGLFGLTVQNMSLLLHGQNFLFQVLHTGIQSSAVKPSWCLQLS